MKASRSAGNTSDLVTKYERVPFPLTPIKAVILGMSLLGSNPLYAEDDVNVSDLKEENARLKQALEQIQKELSIKKTTPNTVEPASANSLQDEITKLKQALQQKEQAASALGNQQPSDTATTQATGLEQAEEKDEAPAEKKSLLKEITVHAAKRSEVAKLKEIPKSISQVSGQELEKYSATSVTDILKRVGNVQWNFGNPRTGSYSMRGLNVGASDLIDPSVVVVVDGVSKAYNGVTSGTDYFDLESTNVTRGPQGAGGRKNSSVGEIVFTSARPSFDNLADASVIYGQNNTVKTQAVVNGAIIDKTLAIRSAFLRNTQDGWYSNAWPDNPQRQGYGNTDRTESKTTLLYTPTDDFKAQIGYFYQPKGMEYVNGVARNTPSPLQFDMNPYNSAGVKLTNLINLTNLTQTKLNRGYFRTALPSFGVNDYYAFPLSSPANGGIINALRSVNINTDYKFSGHNLKYIAGYDDSFFEAANDDLLPYNITLDGGYITRYQQASQEIRLESDLGGLVDYKTGVYSLWTNTYSNNRTRYGGDAGAWNANGITGGGLVGGAGGAITSQYDCLYSGLYCAGAGYQGLNLGNIVVPTVGGPGTLNTAGAAGEGRGILSASLNNVYKNTITNNVNKSQALYGEAAWHLDELLHIDNPLTLTTGARVTYEDRQGDGSLIIADQGAGELLNPVSVGGVQLGGFATNATTGALTATGAALTKQTIVADKAANQFFGKANYASLTAEERVLVAQAQAVRKGQINTLYNTTKADPFKGILLSGNASLSYKIKDAFDNQYTPYFSWQRGAKSGFAQVAAVMNGVTGYGTKLNGVPEISNVYEIGLKTQLFNKKVDLNADFFIDNIENFQQTVQVINPYADPATNCPGQTVCYTSASGNVKGVQVKGVELDAAYRPIDNLGFRFSGAYNDAVYTDYTNSGLPAELTASAFGPTKNDGLYNMTGKQVPRAPQFTGNLASDFSYPVFDKFVFHTNANLNYVGRQNYDLSGSRYGWIDAYWLTDLSVGIGRKDRLFDATFMVKNLFDTSYVTTQSSTSYTPNYGRWIGIQFSTKL